MHIGHNVKAYIGCSVSLNHQNYFLELQKILTIIFIILSEQFQYYIYYISIPHPSIYAYTLSHSKVKIYQGNSTLSQLLTIRYFILSKQKHVRFTYQYLDEPFSLSNLHKNSILIPKMRQEHRTIISCTRQSLSATYCHKEDCVHAVGSTARLARWCTNINWSPYHAESYTHSSHYTCLNQP